MSVTSIASQTAAVISSQRRIERSVSSGGAIGLYPVRNICPHEVEELCEGKLGS
jgi:hypothetical protein